MRWLGVLALLGACGGKGAPPASGGVSLVLDIPNGALDPKGYTAVEVVLHEPSGDLVRSVKVATDGTFDLGDLDPSSTVSVEATLRNDSGAAVGYGRTAAAAALAGGAEIVVPVRRPIAYLAGTVSRGTQALQWSESPATFSDLSVGGSLDGKAQLGSQVVMVIAAGPSLFTITQAINMSSGALTGPATIVPVSTADHQIGSPLAGQLTGAVLDGAGADDGSMLAIGTSTQLFAADPTTGLVRALADGSFARVAILTAATGEIDAIAIKNRGSTTGPCATSAELWWAPLTGGAGAAHMVAVGGFSDVATDRGHAYYVDACKAALGEVTPAAVTVLRTISSTTGTGTGTGRPTALAVSNGQAYLGLETAPATTSLLAASLTTTDAPRMLWTEAAQQVLDVGVLPEVRRQLDASSAVFAHLEVGAGGDYVALTTSAHFHGSELVEVSFPDMTIDTEELRVFDAATGGIVQRYRSWCDGLILINPGDIRGWECASTAGQTAATTAVYEHHLNSMTFLFGKK
jgi:hypothetical protein